MFENDSNCKSLCENDAAKCGDDDGGNRCRGRHEKDRDTKKKQRRESKRRHSDQRVAIRTGTNVASTSSDSDDTIEKRRTRRHSKKRKHRKSDGHRKRKEDDDSHSREKKSKKSNRKDTTSKLDTSSDYKASCNINHSVENETTQRSEQTIRTNPTIPLPKLAGHATEPLKEAPIRTKPTMIPMTRQEYEREQAQIRSVYDPESGRVRLVRGSGEIIESIVRRSEHTVINQIATQMDGQSFARHAFANAATFSRKR